MNRRNRVHESRQIAYVQYLPLKRRRGINIYVFKHIIPQNRNMRVMLINVMAFHPGKLGVLEESPHDDNSKQQENQQVPENPKFWMH